MGAVRLLLVDDEAALLSLMRRYLERLGYEIETCSNAADALALVQADPERFAMVITDLTLPGMNGEELIAEMRRHQPKLRALISSGYPYEPRAPGTGFLQKPFLPDMLAAEVAKALK
jgi:DNA-binding NtrC family response regulator